MAYQPTPPAPLDCSGCGVELFFEVLYRPEAALDGSLQRAVFEPAASGVAGNEVFPE